ncbi:MAG: phosphopantothenoylcysteine decarboxylase [Verrucomicrobiota bacterium]|nr:phosphopantothenoylcysteine decarboxylase [Verrucomicrobiota bacterium]
MKIIVTAGPSYEPIDQVRRVTNFSTGRLGTELALYLMDFGHEVTLLLGELATYHCAALDNTGDAGHEQMGKKGLEIVRFTTADDLLALFTKRKGQAGAIFHCAAVGDFKVASVRDEQGRPLPYGKIPTNHPKVFIEMQPTVKILPRLRKLYPESRIIGWKYEVDGNQDTAIKKGREQIKTSATDGCVVNGPAWGKGYGFLNTTEGLTPADGSPALFRLLGEEVFHLPDFQKRAES